MASKEVTYSYYRGQFRSQFELGSKVGFAHGQSKQFEQFAVKLLPKYQIFGAKAITREEFDQQIQCKEDKAECKCELHTQVDYHVVRSSERAFIELFPEFETHNGRLALFDSYAVFYSSDALKKNAQIGGYYAKEGKSGKFTGDAFIRVIEDEVVVKEALKKKAEGEKPVLPIIGPLSPKKSGGCFAADVLGTPIRGCFNRQLPFGGAGGFGGPTTPGGCFNAARQPGGCFSMGWLGRLLGLLGLLGLLLYLLSLLQTCGRQSGDQVVYIHDTVVVEVIKERVDTLEVVRIDTAKFLKTNKVQTSDMVPLPNVQFETDKDILVPGSLPDIQQLAEFLNKNKHVKARILGHTDNVGDSLHNEDLSKRRAFAVKKLLVQLGVESTRVDYEGFGPRKPKTSNATPEGRLMNRRVEVQLTNTVLETEETVELKKND
jgi:outer membrane protein OmpA-like peptidoglycan-associated protein